VTKIIDPSQVAEAFRAELRARVAAIETPLKLVGLLATDFGPSATYASYTEKACVDTGVAFELRRVQRLEMEREIEAVNQDPMAHGIMIYYPIFGVELDNYLKDQVSPQKDVEGLSSYWMKKLYRDERFIQDRSSKKAILPCTPLAIIKLLDAAGVTVASVNSATGPPLEGKTVTVFNRSEVVGRPLAAMLAHDGARVLSFDIGGPLVFSSQGMEETNLSRRAALEQSELVVTGVPDRNFALIQASEIRSDAVCINFSTIKNFDDAAREKARIFIPRVGPMTVTMALRNTIRLFENFHSR
jgi:methylenetetrahydrofolate dehydrogenase (NADP+)/methenyltetrahydrofolate cyclohydrolase